MKIFINGNPVYTVTENTCGFHDTACQVDEYLRHASQAHTSTDVAYRYIGNMAEDIGRPTWMITKYVGAALWNDSNSVYDAITQHLVKIFGS